MSCDSYLTCFLKRIWLQSFILIVMKLKTNYFCNKPSKNLYFHKKGFKRIEQFGATSKSLEL